MGSSSCTEFKPNRHDHFSITPKSYNNSHYLSESIGMEVALQANINMHSMLRNNDACHQDDITRVLAEMPSSQLKEILLQFKVIDLQNPYKARKILLKLPALAKTLLQAEIILGCIRMKSLHPQQIITHH